MPLKNRRHPLERGTEKRFSERFVLEALGGPEQTTKGDATVEAQYKAYRHPPYPIHSTPPCRFREPGVRAEHADSVWYDNIRRQSLQVPRGRSRPEGRLPAVRLPVALCRDAPPE